MREKIQNFRLDRIYRTSEPLAEELQIPSPKDFNLAEYSREIFRMFGTDEAVEVELLCKNYIMNAVIDYFGSKIVSDQKSPVLTLANPYGKWEQNTLTLLA